LAASKREEERLQSEFLMASTLYTNLAQQLERAKIKVQENTPIFEVIELARVAIQKSGPKEFGFGRDDVLEVFVGVGIIFVRMLLKETVLKKL
jgi:hypothetical protein